MGPFDLEANAVLKKEHHEGLIVILGGVMVRSFGGEVQIQTFLIQEQCRMLAICLPVSWSGTCSQVAAERISLEACLGNNRVPAVDTLHSSRQGRQGAGMAEVVVKGWGQPSRCCQSGCFVAQRKATLLVDLLMWTFCSTQKYNPLVDLLMWMLCSTQKNYPLVDLLMWMFVSTQINSSVVDLLMWMG